MNNYSVRDHAMTAFLPPALRRIPLNATRLPTPSRVLDHGAKFAFAAEPSRGWETPQ